MEVKMMTRQQGNSSSSYIRILQWIKRIFLFSVCKTIQHYINSTYFGKCSNICTNKTSLSSKYINKKIFFLLWSSFIVLPSHNLIFVLRPLYVKIKLMMQNYMYCMFILQHFHQIFSHVLPPYPYICDFLQDLSDIFSP